MQDSHYSIDHLNGSDRYKSGMANVYVHGCPIHPQDVDYMRGWSAGLVEAKATATQHQAAQREFTNQGWPTRSGI